VNWDAIGAIGQVLGSIAVFITLGYLAVQVRHQRQENRRALSQGRAQSARELTGLFLDEKTVAYIAQANAALGVPEFPFIDMLMEKTGLTSEAVNRLLTIEFMWWDFRVQTIPFAQDLGPGERAGFDFFIRGTYGLPGFSRLVYENILKPMTHPDAVRYIDGVLAQPG